MYRCARDVEEILSALQRRCRAVCITLDGFAPTGRKFKSRLDAEDHKRHEQERSQQALELGDDALTMLEAAVTAGTVRIAGMCIHGSAGYTRLKPALLGQQPLALWPAAGCLKDI